MFVGVDGHIDLKKDPVTSSVISSDVAGYEDFMRLHEARKSKEERIDALENKLNNIEDMLRVLIETSKR